MGYLTNEDREALADAMVSYWRGMPWWREDAADDERAIWRQGEGRVIAATVEALIARHRAEAAREALREAADRLADWEFPPGSDALEPMYRLVVELRNRAEQTGGAS